MNTRRKILVDRLLGLPLALAFNLLARLIALFVRRDHSIRDENTRAIAVAKFVGMGSILQATPLLRALKGRFPRASLVFVTSLSNRPMIERLEHIDEALYIDGDGVLRLAWTTLVALAALVRRGIDLYLDLELYSAYASLVAVMSLARNRMGLYRHSARFKRGIYTHLVYFNTGVPLRRLYLQLGLVAGAAWTDEALGTIRVTDQDRRVLREKLRDAPGGPPEGPYVVVNPNASDLLLERRWPQDAFVQAVEAIAARGLGVVLIGSRQEADYVEDLVSKLSPAARGRVRSTAGRLTLGELFALLEGAACALTNDTGPMHMAFALRRPTVCLFGPARPEHHVLEREGVEVFYESVFCSPCLHEIDEPPCAGNNVCMQRIPPARVVEAVLRLAAGNTGRRGGMPPAPPTDTGRARDRQEALRDGRGIPLGLVVRAAVRDLQP